jgi:hypothetical protein
MALVAFDVWRAHDEERELEIADKSRALNGEVSEGERKMEDTATARQTRHRQTVDV